MRRWKSIPLRLSRFIYTFLAAGLLLSATSAAFGADAGPIASEGDVLTQARALSSAKQRPEALALLQKHLVESPTDVDARLLYGEMLSWEGRWEEARDALEAVLNQTPTYTDAALALINVELWSDHPTQADQIANRFLERTPNHIDLLLARARVMRALKRPKEEMQALNTVLRLEPANAEAKDMRRSLEEQSKEWRYRRPACQHDRLRRPLNAHPDRHRGQLPKRALAAQEQRKSHEHAALKTL